MNMRNSIFVLGVVFSTLIASAGSASMQNPSKNSNVDASSEDVLRINTTLVILPVRVMDRQGKFLNGLTLEQFQVYEDGQRQEIKYFEVPGPANESDDPAQKTETKPLTVALMLDVSDSTKLKLDQIQSTASVFVSLLRPADRVMIVAFDKRVQVLTEATQDRQVLREGIHKARSGGGTSLYQALDLTIRKLDRVGGRKAIVILTDGVDTASKGITSDVVLRMAEQSYVSIYPVQYNTYGDFSDNASRETYGAGEFNQLAHVTKGGEPASEAYKRAGLYLRLLADRTNGQFQYSDSAKNLGKCFVKIAAQLRQQYTLGYYPTNQIENLKPRQIKVEVAAPKVTVDTRKSYIYKPLTKQ